MVDEVYHLRNVFSHFGRSFSRSDESETDATNDLQASYDVPTISTNVSSIFNPSLSKALPSADLQPSTQHPQTTPESVREARAASRRQVLLSSLILIIAIALLAADVLAVYLTQPLVFESSTLQYNLRGTQPAFTNMGLARFIHRLTKDAPCITPTFVSPKQQRKYSLSACVGKTSDIMHGENEAFVGNVTVSSFFHEGGSDHFATFSDDPTFVDRNAPLRSSAFHVRQRAMLYSFAQKRYRLLFETSSDVFELTRYLHDVFIYETLERSCNGVHSNSTCNDLAASLQTLERHTVVRSVEKWAARGGSVTANVSGLESTYRVRLESAGVAIDFGAAPLSTTAHIHETEGEGLYSNITHEARISGLPGLLSEDGRVIGLAAFSILLVAAWMLLLTLRMTLQPISLAAMAWGETGRRKKEAADMTNPCKACGCDRYCAKPPRGIPGSSLGRTGAGRGTNDTGEWGGDNRNIEVQCEDESSTMIHGGRVASGVEGIGTNDSTGRLARSARSLDRIGTGFSLDEDDGYWTSAE